MTKGDKLVGDTRRTAILNWLSEDSKPITGSELARRSNVSRQIIVQDISILKAKNHEIFATAQGYMLLPEPKNSKVTQLLACKHDLTQTKEELYIMVDHGLIVRDVIVEHSLYGELTASLMIKTRADADLFYKQISQSGSQLLSTLTEGVHLHTVEAEEASQIEQAKEALRISHILLEDN